MENIVLVVRPEEVSAGAIRGQTPAHLAYRMGDGPHLFRAKSPVAPRGGLMVIEDSHYRSGEEAEIFCNEVLRECAARRFSGVVCRFGGSRHALLSRTVSRLGEVCARRGLGFYVTEPYADTGVGKVLISTAISGGTLRGRLEAAQERWGKERIALWIERVAEDFILPSPTGTGTPLTEEELQQRREKLGGAVFFSAELCAYYFTYMVGETGHFVLFDDGSSIARKLKLGEELGITTAFLRYEDCRDFWAELFGT